ncbi:MAG: hypothetical protein ACM3XM_13060 [Mycobacterium leprae]
MPTVMALFQSNLDTERAIAELSLNGFSEKDVALVIFSALQPPKKQRGLLSWLARGGFLGDTLDSSDGRSVMDGVGVGGLIGTLAGLIYGSLWRYGPITGAVLGLLGGGLIGYVLDCVIPDRRKDQFETALNDGMLLVQVNALVGARAEEAMRIMNGNNAKQVAVLPVPDHVGPG